ncbi:hypothetical protein VD0002_g405 [Verticillium dahliae]|uniref:Uncharacterized protein n=2 Tax=Verticillium dahliae TaxID=27337 RepID=G2WRA8_VERDV|nr:uncharacterized protein VDAG_00091 [Verticillium dahliae VdLs.17]KAH6709858.1 hypothetical protein EV126DRAFT_374947 [Verticillium dahliae]EGY13409.1 hypothetical protein VDAG_00091 [Verticillium dahliae VdLs.17]PNH29696.1 hypothetical protein BJF96_g7095 [Verticillium dahliae]PNH40195.1 hypothetical protein VD0004_g6751 [Verticillium dahliae]PNH56902.1 hypothetical protein VD0003_g865 [Verticillium dahliae]
MVVIVDLEDENVELTFQTPAPRRVSVAKPNAPRLIMDDDLHEPSTRSIFQNCITRAFGQYPIVESVVQHIDLNTLDSLSRTSYLIHEGLIQYRSSLLKATIRCINSEEPVDPESTLRFRARAGNHYFETDPRSLRAGSYLPYNGKSGQCARDLVSECRLCGVPVCRNCTIKRPGAAAAAERHRRLCTSCVDAPIGALLGPPVDPDTPQEADEVQRELCQCDENAGVWLCQPCGKGIRASDSDYNCVWKWRSHYGEVLGGLGTGIGDGDRGVICGRESDCVAAKEVEQETDCDAEDARESSLETITPPGTPGSFLHRQDSSSSVSSHERQRTPSPLQLGPGYERHEIEGIGGVVKKKLVRMVRVGACVPEWEDEKSKRKIMNRERSHQVRSFCGWCYRVIPSKSEKMAAKSGQATGLMSGPVA